MKFHWSLLGILGLSFCVMRGYQGDMVRATFCAVFGCFGFIMAKLEDMGGKK